MPDRRPPAGVVGRTRETGESLIGDDLFLAAYEADSAAGKRDLVDALYAEIYAEAPYREGPKEMRAFAQGWPRRLAQPGFRLVLARPADGDREPIAFGFGYQLAPDTHWWETLIDPMPAELTEEWPGRTFAIIELAVRPPDRRRGIGRALHDALLSDRSEERVTLLVRPDASAPQAAYAAWGYRPHGRTHGDLDVVYVLMTRPLPV